MNMQNHHNMRKTGSKNIQDLADMRLDVYRVSEYMQYTIITLYTQYLLAVMNLQ